MTKHKLLFAAFMLAAAAMTTTAQTNQRYYWVGGGVNKNWGLIENWSSASGGAPSQRGAYLLRIATADGFVKPKILSWSKFRK